MLLWKTPDVRPKDNAADEEIPWHMDVAELAFFGGRSQLYVLLEDGEAALFDIDSRARRALPSALANREEAPILDDELSKRMSQHVCSMGCYVWPLRMCEGG